MDQIKIGKFIAQLRKGLKLTQRELADKLEISDKTVSKWECGKGLPEVSLMLPLCEILNINVNELLSGEKLDDSNYKRKAEDNMMNLIREKQENIKKIILSCIVAFITIIAAVVMILVAGITDLPVVARIALIATALVVMVLGVSVACVLERDTGVYECPKCGAKFVPSMKSFIMAPHIITTRHLKCPECGKRSYCKKKLSQDK